MSAPPTRFVGTACLPWTRPPENLLSSQSEELYAFAPRHLGRPFGSKTFQPPGAYPRAGPAKVSVPSTYLMSGLACPDATSESAAAMTQMLSMPTIVPQA